MSDLRARVVEAIAMATDADVPNPYHNAELALDAVLDTLTENAELRNDGGVHRLIAALRLPEGE